MPGIGLLVRYEVTLPITQPPGVEALPAIRSPTMLWLIALRNRLWLIRTSSKLALSQSPGYKPCASSGPKTTCDTVNPRWRSPPPQTWTPSTWVQAWPPTSCEPS